MHWLKPILLAVTAGATLSGAGAQHGGTEWMLDAAETPVVEGAPRPFGLLGGPPRPYSGADYAAGLAALRASIPDLRVESEAIGPSTYRLRFTGNFTGAPLLGYPANGAPVRFDGVDEVQRDASGRHRRIVTITDSVALLRAITAATPAPAPVVPLRPEVVHRARTGDFVECIAVEPDGSILMSMLYAGRVDRLRPDGRIETVARLPGHTGGAPGFICLARSPDGAIYLTSQHRDSAGKPVAGIWAIERGTLRQLAMLPEGAQPNGITTDGRGGLIAGDNQGGLWRVDLASGAASRWITHPLLSRRDYIGQYPAANGVQRHGDTIHVANSDRGLLVVVPIAPDGSAGTPSIIAEGVPGDDFALAADGSAYVTTHPYDSVIRVAPDGARTVVATRAEAMAGPTSAAIATRDGVPYLYVANDGGLFAGLPPERQTPGIVRFLLDGTR